MNKDLVKPTVHMGGTPRTHLVDQLSEAITALSNAVRITGHAHPHGRDYINRPDDYERASCQHTDRLIKLNDVIDELSELREAILDGVS